MPARKPVSGADVGMETGFHASIGRIAEIIFKNPPHGTTVRYRGRMCFHAKRPR